MTTSNFAGDQDETQYPVLSILLFAGSRHSQRVNVDQNGFLCCPRLIG